MSPISVKEHKRGYFMEKMSEENIKDTQAPMPALLVRDDWDEIFAGIYFLNFCAFFITNRKTKK